MTSQREDVGLILEAMVASAPLSPQTGSGASMVASAVIATSFVYPARVSVFNTSAGALYLQLFSAPSAQPDGAIPDDQIEVPARSRASIAWGAPVSRWGALWVALSSTCEDLTIAGDVGIFSWDLYPQLPET